MRFQRDNEEQKLEFMEKMQTVVTNERLQTAVYGASIGKSLAGLAVTILMLVKMEALSFAGHDSDSIVMIFKTGAKILLIVMAVIMAISVIQNIIAVVIVLKGEDATPSETRFLHIVTAIKAAFSYLIMAAFGVVFGCFGGVAAFTKTIQKDDGVTVIGFVFMLIGIGMVISSLVSGVKSVKADLEASDQ